MKIIHLAWLLLLLMRLSQQDPAWKGIELFKSTRADVDRLFGARIEVCKHNCDYKTSSGRVFVRYSGERCARDESGSLNVFPDTVITLRVSPFVGQELKDLKLDMKKFKRTKDPELQCYSTVTNTEAGITYEVSDKIRFLALSTLVPLRILKRCGSLAQSQIN